MSPVPDFPPWALVTARRIAHVERVAGLVTRWADAMAITPEERARWLRAVWLHDALRDAEEPRLRQLAPGTTGPADLLHGPAAAARARQDGEDDQGVLDAVSYHSVGYAGWDMAGKVLYCADFLEPGRHFDPAERAELATRFPDDPEQVLQEVARRRLLWLVRSGWHIPEATWRFWNSVAPGEVV
jgi:HD superfamily phosphohydrolase YqeK